MQGMKTAIFVFMLTAAGSAVFAGKNEPIIFPKEGQTKEQMLQDKAYCREWAQEETGVDPVEVEVEIKDNKEKVTAQEEGAVGGFLKGIFKGAATGAATGAIDKNVDSAVGSDALKGAVLGGVFTHEKRKDKAEEIEYRGDVIEREELKEEYDEYLRAYIVCLEAKGYAVK